MVLKNISIRYNKQKYYFSQIYEINISVIFTRRVKDKAKDSISCIWKLKFDEKWTYNICVVKHRFEEQALQKFVRIVDGALRVLKSDGKVNVDWDRVRSVRKGWSRVETGTRDWPWGGNIWGLFKPAGGSSTTPLCPSISYVFFLSCPSSEILPVRRLQSVFECYAFRRIEF